MKRVLALVLALVMVLAPMSAFAASDNTVNKVPKVSTDAKFDVAADAPQLRIEEKNSGEFGAAGDVNIFRLELENAKWLKDSDFSTDFETEMTSVLGNFDSVKRLTDSTVQVAVYGGQSSFKLPMLAKPNGSGELKVTVDPRDSVISGGTYTFAIASSGATVTTVESAKTVTRGSSKEGATIMIDETNIKALGDSGTQKFRLRLPKNFTWDETATENAIVLPSSMNVNSVTADGRNLTVELNVTAGSDIRRTITITPFFNVNRSSDHGEVEVDLHGYDKITSETGLLVANYKDYGITVEMDDDEVVELIAGKLNDEYKDDYVTAKIIIKEVIENSLFDGRTIDFKLPEWVKIKEDVSVVLNHKGDGTNTDWNLYVDKYGSEFELTVPSNTEKEELEIELPITIKANQAGDVVLNLEGAGIEETELVIAEALAPIEAEIEVADVRIGLQEQAAPDIIITELVKGALEEGEDLTVSFANDFGFYFDDADVEVIDGDLEIDEDNIDVDDQLITIPVKAISTEPSKIKISNITMTLDRNVPEGPFKVKIGGSALIENNYDVANTSPAAYYDLSELPEDYYNKHFTGSVVSEVFANVVTRAGGVVASEAKFVIGEATYTVLMGGKYEEKVMDTAAFIENGRTMLPVRYVAEALGVSDQNIVWNGEARTVTIFKDARVVQLTIDNDVMMVNGVPVQMDSAAIIRAGRTFLPVRFVAQALNADIAWDAATRTVTINQ